MKRYLSYVVGAAATVFVVGTVYAVVTMPGDLEKHRADITKQTNKLVACMAKAAIKCESKGANSATECDLEAGTATTPDANANAKFAEAAGPGGKCESKLDFLKKGPAGDYSQLGCPGDSDDVTPGDQPYADFAAVEAAARENVAEAINLITPALQGLCGGVPTTDNEAVASCMEVAAKGLLKYAKGAGKCQLKCENDHDDEIGDGGDADNTECNIGDSTDANFNTCISEASAKGKKKIPTEACGAAGDPGCMDLAEYGIVETAVSNALDDTVNDGYNEDDCP
jgi:hypothetical protein